MSRPRIAAFTISIVITGIIELTSRLHRKQVMEKYDNGREANAIAAHQKFREYRKYIPQTLLQARGLTDIVRQLIFLVERVEKGEVPFHTPSAYLTSVESELFFTKAIFRMKFLLKVVDRSVVRSRPGRAVMAFFVVLLSCSFSVSAALATAESCTATIVFFQFLEFFSLSFLTALGIMIFAGFSDYNRFRYIYMDTYPFTEDEKFIISLVAANRDFQLNGFVKEDFADYANVGLEGQSDAFVPLHKSLLPYSDFDVMNST